eukprot:gene4499-4752_t
MFQDSKGFSQVLAELERAHLEYHRSEHRPMLYAASVPSQRVYALVEGRYQDVGAMPGHPATFRVSKVHHILALQVAGGRVVRLWLRRQLTEEDKDELLHEPLACYSCPFPRESLRLADAAMRGQGRRHMSKEAAVQYLERLRYSHKVDVFDEELKLQDIWMFRGPINDKEAQLFLEYDRQRAVAQAAQAASVQEDVRQARRAQREQQLRELLSWMTSYQQQWTDSVAHVQKALARQEQLAKAQQLWQKLGDQGFVLPPLPQQQQEQLPSAGRDAGFAVVTELQQQQEGELACSSNDDRQSDSSRTWD